jgi:XTP/dITP diphosphohydrolase
MKIILATANQGKVREFVKLLSDYDVVAYSDEIGVFDIQESGDSFAQNALIKAKAVFNASNKESLVLADDSGISVPALGGEPGIFSARYAKEGATDRENLLKLIDRLKELSLDETPAFYTASLALVSPFGEYVVHGWMYGKVSTRPKGDGGFGYDPIFTPDGFKNSLGELESEIKAKISHRSKAISNIKPILKMLELRSSR